MWRRQARLLDRWLAATTHKPLILRGARQVGKTWLVRDLAKRSGRRLLEINFERDPRRESLFEPNDPDAVVANLELFTNRSISDEGWILFLDEIQAAPRLISKLRWFAEERPKLPVVAAGSLLEFALGDRSFSVPAYRLLSLPHYLAWNLGSILEETT